MPFAAIIKKKHPLIERIVIYAGHVYLFIYHKYVCFSFASPFVKYTCTMHQMDLGLVVCVFFFSLPVCAIFSMYV